MDPVATLRAAREALDDNDVPTAFNALRDYAAWRWTGGFEPQIDGDRGDEIAAALRVRLEQQFAAQLDPKA